MLKYLVILLDDTSIAFCHANNPLTLRSLMPLDVLKKAIVFGMKENLMIQYVMPSDKLPDEYYPVLESIDNIKIGVDVIVYDFIPDIADGRQIVLRIPFQTFINEVHRLVPLMKTTERISVCYTNIEEFSDDYIPLYTNALRVLVPFIVNADSIENERVSDLNLLTDRLQLTKMNNCGAGIDTITIAPNGMFYICPAFYYDEMTGIDNKLNHINPSSSFSVGSIHEGLSIPNRHLYQIKYSPLCRTCDAFHCNRCVWLSQKLTWEVNTPSHQQCVMSHVERSVAREIAISLKQKGISTVDIPQIDYLDPFYSQNRF